MKHKSNTLHTPYHSLGGDNGLRVPGWVDRRSVYRAEGRTVYLVKTSCINMARRDLNRLQRAGWHVEVDRQDSGDAAVISVSQGLALQAA